MTADLIAKLESAEGPSRELDVVSAYLAKANDAIALAKEAQAENRPDIALQCALIAAEYTRAARAIDNMNKAALCARGEG